MIHSQPTRRACCPLSTHWECLPTHRECLPTHRECLLTTLGPPGGPPDHFQTSDRAFRPLLVLQESLPTPPSPPGGAPAHFWLPRRSSDHSTPTGMAYGSLQVNWKCRKILSSQLEVLLNDFWSTGSGVKSLCRTESAPEQFGPLLHRTCRHCSGPAAPARDMSLMQGTYCRCTRHAVDAGDLQPLQGMCRRCSGCCFCCTHVEAAASTLRLSWQH